MKSKVLKGLQKAFKGDVFIMEEADFASINNYISSGNYAFNAILSGSIFGGFSDKISILSGFSSTGKTYLALNAVREAQKKGYTPVYIDTESAVNKEICKSFGIHTENIVLFSQNIVFKVESFIANLIEIINKENSGEKFFIVLDSLGMLATEKEINNAKDSHAASDMGLRAKEIRRMFRVLTLDLAKAQIPFLIINHVSMSTGTYVPEIKQGGGEGVVYAPTIIVNLSTSNLKDEEDDKSKVGVVVTAKTQKNRLALPESVQFHISFKKSMNKYVGLEKFCTWEGCGIAKGKLKELEEPVFDENGEPVLWKGKQKMAFQGNYEFVPSDAKDSKIYAVKHLGKNLKLGKDFWNETVFTDEVLKNLDENCVKPKMQYGKSDEDVLMVEETNEETNEE